jgi:hypothetical protein
MQHDSFLTVELFSDTQPRAATAWIVLPLGHAWGQRFAGQQAQLWRSATDALGYLWRAHAPSRLLTHEGFDVLIFAGMKGQNSQAPPRTQSR